MDNEILLKWSSIDRRIIDNGMEVWRRIIEHFYGLNVS